MTQPPPAPSAAAPPPVNVPTPLDSILQNPGNQALLGVCVAIIVYLLAHRRLSESAFQDSPPAPRLFSWAELGMIVGVYLLVSLMNQGAAQLIAFVFIAGISSIRAQKVNWNWVGDIGTPRLWGRLILITAGSLLFTQGVSILSTALYALIQGKLPDPVAHVALKQLQEADRNIQISIAISAIIIAPIMEEIIFRGFLQRALAGLIGRQWPAIAITSLAFALVHIGPADPLALPMLFVLSLGMGYALAATGRIWAPMLVHAVFNATQIVIVLSGYTDLPGPGAP